MGASQQPEVSVKIGASTVGLGTGFSQAVKMTEDGVAKMQAALSRLDESQVRAEMWTRRRAAAEREAYSIAERMATVQTTVARTVNVTAQATEVSAVKYAQAAQKSIILADALSRTGQISGGIVAKMIGLGTTASMVFGPAGVAALAIGSFATLFLSKMGEVQQSIEETRKKWRDTIDGLINAGDIAALMKELREVQEGTRAQNYEDGINASRRRVAALEQERRALEQRGALFAALAVQGKLEDEQAKLEALLEKYRELAGRIRNIPGAPRTIGTDPITITADAPGRKPPSDAAYQRELKDAADLDRAYYERQQMLAGDSYERRHALALDWLASQSAIYGADSAEYLRALTDVEQMEREQRDRLLAMNAEEYRANVATINAERELRLQTIEEYEMRWAFTLDRIHGMLERSFRGFFELNETLGESFRNLGRTILGAMVNAALESAKAWLVSHLTTQALGEATARKTVANAAVEAAARAWAATVGIPIVGPLLAPAAAAASFAGVLAFGGSIASAAGGWENVPQDQLALVHKNEMVLPATLAEGLRSMVESGSRGGGGGTVNITALDAQSFEGMLRRNEGPLVRILRELARDGQLSLA